MVSTIYRRLEASYTLVNLLVSAVAQRLRVIGGLLPAQLAKHITTKGLN